MNMQRAFVLYSKHQFMIKLCFLYTVHVYIMAGSGSSLKNSGSLNSLQRRFLRNVTTSLEALGEVGLGEESGGGVAVQGHHRRSTKLGIAVIIQLGGSNRTELER